MANSSSSIFISIETNERVTDIYYEMVNIYMPALADHIMDSYSVLLKYLFESKIKEYNFNSGIKSLVEISNGYIGDINFLEDKYPENPSEKDIWIKRMCEIYENELNDISIESYEEFINHPYLRYVLDLSESEKIRKITEKAENQGDWGEDPDYISTINVMTLESSTKKNCEELVKKQFEYSEYVENGFLDVIDYEMISKKIIKSNTLETLNDLRSFYYQLTKEMIHQLNINDFSYPKEVEEKIDSLRMDIKCKEIDNESWGGRDYFDLEDCYPILESALENDLDIEECANKAIEHTLIRQKKRESNILDKFKNKRITLSGLFRRDNQLYVREKLINIINSIGATYVQDIEQADILIIGDKAGGKKDKAELLNIKIINFDDFEYIIKTLGKY